MIEQRFDAVLAVMTFMLLRSSRRCGHAAHGDRVVDDQHERCGDLAAACAASAERPRHFGAHQPAMIEE
jgi:hypothetical protein